MKIQKYLTIVVLLVGLQAHSQTPTSTASAADQNLAAGTEDPTAAGIEEENSPALSGDSESAMQVPAPISARSYSLTLPSEAVHSNYLDMGLTFVTAYDDNTLGNATRVADTTYSVLPMLGWYQSTARAQWSFTYSPGFTFYQHQSAFNSADHNLSVDSQFRVSPHVTLLLREGLFKQSNPLEQLLESAGYPLDITQPAVSTVISPLANQINNFTSVQLTYQFGRNSMIGATGIFSELHYLNSKQVPGLFDSDTKAAQGFYLHRMSSKHYVGIRYEFQNLLFGPSPVPAQTHSLALFYTTYLQRSMSLSVFVGPQYSETHGGGGAPLRWWSPIFGASFNWQGSRTSVTIEAARAINAVGGLQNASRSDSVKGSVRQQLTRLFSGEVRAFYSNNDVVALLPTSTGRGNSAYASVLLHHIIREHLSLSLAYTHLYQNYPYIQALSSDPNRSGISLALSYRFERPIGR